MGDGLRRLTEIRRSGRGSRRRVTLYLDGEVWRTTTVGVVHELRIAADEDVDPEVVDRDARELERPEARERALRLLGYRERSVAELRGRLEEDGYPPDIVAETVADLERTQLVDDERFAMLRARSLVAIRGYGRSRARRELTRSGLDPDLADRALDDAAPPDEEEDRAAAAARRIIRPSDTIDRLAARLVRRGFAPGVAFQAARQALPTHEEPDATDRY